MTVTRMMVSSRLLRMVMKNQVPGRVPAGGGGLLQCDGQRCANAVVKGHGIVAHNRVGIIGTIVAARLAAAVGGVVAHVAVIAVAKAVVAARLVAAATAGNDHRVAGAAGIIGVYRVIADLLKVEAGANAGTAVIDVVAVGVVGGVDGEIPDPAAGGPPAQAAPGQLELQLTVAEVAGPIAAVGEGGGVPGAGRV